jgi:hypothetical protein
LITKNWAAVPLVSHQTVIDLISATTTKTGLTITAELDPGDYPVGVKHSDAELAAVPLAEAAFQPRWNYTIYPNRQSMPPETTPGQT